MREAIGSTWIYQLVVIFILLFVAFLILSLTFSKNYKTKNELINIIEKYEGVNDQSVRIINSYLTQTGNRVRGKCPSADNTTWLAAPSLNSTQLVTPQANERYFYCVSIVCNFMKGVVKMLINFLAKYGFFDNNYTLRDKGYNGQDKMSIQQFIVMGIIFVLIILISILLRKVKKEKVLLIYKVLSFIMPVLEVAKMTFSGTADINHGEGFNWGGGLPLYTCSMLLYFLPIVAFGKGKFQKWSMAFFTTVGIAAGLSNFIYLSAAGWYPLFTFGCVYSIFFHAVLVFVGMSLLITGLYKPSIKTLYEGIIPVIVFGLLVIPLNFIIKTIPNNGFVDYMLLMDCNGFIPKITDFFKEHHIQLLFSLIGLFIGYPIVHALLSFIEMGIIKICDLFKKHGSIENQLID